MEKLNIGIIIGSTREGRFSEHSAKWLYELGKNHEALNLELIDLRDHTLPFLEARTNPSQMNGMYPDPQVAAWAEKIKSLDGYIVVTPEYNRSTSAVLKSALDHIYGEFAQKPIAFVSYGSVGGARAVEQLRLMAVEHQMAPIRTAVHIMAPWNLREADGTLKSGALDSYVQTAIGMLEQLVWWAHALKHARHGVEITPSHVAVKTA
jgi:NAD(P)H-dependent FMN reductase